MHIRDAEPTSTTTTLQSLLTAEDTRIWLPHSYWVFFPGFGINFCPDVEAAFAEVTRATGQSFCVSPNPVTLDPEEIASAVLARVDKERDGRHDVPVTLHLYGISMGGMIAYDVARSLKRSGNGVTVDAIVFDSSPAGPDSVSGLKQLGPWWGGMVNRLPNLPLDIPNPLKGGPLGRAALHTVEALGDNVANRRWPLTWDDVSFAWHKAAAVTGRGVANQLDYIDSFFPASWPADDVETRFAYLRAENALDDTTVDVQTAVGTYSGLVAPHALSVYPVPQGRHASADLTVLGYRQVLQRFINDAGLTTVADMKRRAARSGELPRP